MKLRGSALLKAADRYAGIPLVAALGLLLRRRTVSGPPRSIGLLRTAAIGDTLLLAGPLDDLRAAHPAADLVLITGQDNAGAGALVCANRARHVVVSVHRPIAALRTIRALRLDWLFDTGAWPRIDASIVALSGANLRIGFRTSGQFRHFAFDVPVDHLATVHEVENFRSLLRAAGVRAGLTPTLARESLPQTSDACGNGAIVFHPWSGGYRAALKEWPTSRWVELATRLRTFASRVLVSGAASDAERSELLAAQLRSAGVDATSLAGTLSIAQLAALLCTCRALVSVNTGVMHLGALLGVPTVSLEGPTPPTRWGPIGPATFAVVTATPNCGYLNLGFEYSGQRDDCMDGIAVEAVDEAVRRLARP